MHFLTFLIPPLLAGLLSAGGWVALWRWQPGVPALIFSLFSESPVLIGIWLVLVVIGGDFIATAARNTLAFRNVGAKASSHWSLSGGRR